jgi:hypothetical protein
MVPLYVRSTRKDLGPGDYVKVECIACGHDELLTAQMLGTAGPKPIERVLDREPRRRCRECDARGKVAVSIKWAARAIAPSYNQPC